MTTVLKHSRRLLFPETIWTETKPETVVTERPFDVHRVAIENDDTGDNELFSMIITADETAYNSWVSVLEASEANKIDVIDQPIMLSYSKNIALCFPHDTEISNKRNMKNYIAGLE